MDTEAQSAPTFVPARTSRALPLVSVSLQSSSGRRENRPRVCLLAELRTGDRVHTATVHLEALIDDLAIVEHLDRDVARREESLVPPWTTESVSASPLARRSKPRSDRPSRVEDGAIMRRPLSTVACTVPTSASSSHVTCIVMLCSLSIAAEMSLSTYAGSSTLTTLLSAISVLTCLSNLGGA